MGATGHEQRGTFANRQRPGSARRAVPGQRALDASRVVTLPEDVQEAAILTAVQLYRSRGVDSMVASESIGDWSVSYFAAKAEGKSPIPGIAQALLAPYVIHRVS